MVTNKIIETIKSLFKKHLEEISLPDDKKDKIYQKFLELLENLVGNFKDVLDSIKEAVVVIDEEGNIQEANKTFFEWLSLSKNDVIGRNIKDFVFEDIENKIVYLKNHELIPVELHIKEFEINNKKYKRLIASNIKNRVEFELKLKNLLRLYKVLSKINELIIRAVNKEEVFSLSCEILVKEGHFDFAWIGELRGENIVPVAWFGENETFAKTLKNRVFKQKNIKELITHSYLKESNLQKEEKAFFNKITIPIFKEENAISAVVSHKEITAVLVVYYKGKEFDEDEITLLKQIAHDIGFGIVTLSRKEDVDYLAYYDVLTSLPNRRYFFEELESLLSILKEKDQQGMLAIVDINNFKTINSAVGFWAGDIVLSQISSELKKILKNKDILARVGGDEFALFLYNVKSKEEAIYRITSVLKDFEFIFEIENKKFLVTLSIGAAFFPYDGTTKEVLFASAEAALKEAKKRGKGIEFFSKSLQQSTLESLNLESELVEAIKKDEFCVFYQPIVDIKEKRVFGAEALIRWIKNGEIVPPFKFIPILEERGLIKEVGAMVMDKVFSFIKEEKLNIPISINVSAKQVHLNFYKEVLDLIEKYSISPSNVILEVTESVLMENLEILLKNIKELNAVGIRFEIDDFGTGYSSLAYLKKLPICALKIDRAFIKDLPDDEEDVSISKAIISMGHSLGKKIIAEGVETKEQLKFLEENNCDYVQGYYFGKPMPKDEFLTFLKEFRWQE